MDIIEILAAGKKHTLHVVNTGKLLMADLNQQTELCPEFSKSIVSKKILGEGEYGEAMLVEIDGKEYVAKKTEVEVDFTTKKYVGKAMPVIDILKQYADTYDISLEAMKLYNQHWEYQFAKECVPELKHILETKSKKELKKYTKKLDVIPRDDTKQEYIEVILDELDERQRSIKGDMNDEVTNLEVIIPISDKNCINKSPVKYWDSEDNIRTINPPSYLCPKESYSEYVISLYGDVLRRKGFYNFMKVFGFVACPERRKHSKFEQIMKTSHYIFMEKIDGPIKSLGEKSMEDKNSLVLQLIFAIAAYQHYFKISHNDLHGGNIFIKKITRNHELYNAKYFHASVLGKDFYWPRGKYLVKIGDFGLSVKWKDPVVGYKSVIKGEFDVIPNWYSPAYDLVFSLNYLYETRFHDNLLLGDVLNCIFPEKSPRSHYIDLGDLRPYLNKLPKINTSAIDVFKHCHALEKYASFPRDEKVKTIGSIK